MISVLVKEYGILRKTYVSEDQGSSQYSDDHTVIYLLTKNGILSPFKRQSEEK